MNPTPDEVVIGSLIMRPGSKMQPASAKMQPAFSKVKPALAYLKLVSCPVSFCRSHSIIIVELSHKGVLILSSIRTPSMTAKPLDISGFQEIGPSGKEVILPVGPFFVLIFGCNRFEIVRL